MIATKTKTQWRPKPLEKAASTAAITTIRHAAGSIRKAARALLVSGKGPSRPGQPPHQHKGAPQRRAIWFDMDATSAVIGPRASIADQSLSPHEFGGHYKGQNYPERPTMLPALQEVAPRFAGKFAGSIGR
jgi:hypothetical protein